MNQLQHISEEEHGKVLVTLNPPYGPKPETIVSRQPFSHPMFTAEARHFSWSYLSSLNFDTSQTPWAQENLSSIQNVRGITFAGAWTKYGFHEDGFTSGMMVASKYLGAQAPFTIKGPDRQPSFYGDSTARLWDRLEAWRIWIVAILLCPLLRLVSILQEASKRGEDITRRYTGVTKSR